MKKEQLTFKDLKKELLKEKKDDLEKQFAATGEYGIFTLFVNNVKEDMFTSRTKIDAKVKSLFENAQKWNYKEWTFNVKWEGNECFVTRTKFGNKPF